MVQEGKLDSLLQSCARCVEHSRDLWEKSCETIRASKSAVLASRALLAQSDRTIERLRMVMDLPGAVADPMALKTQEFQPVIVSGHEFNGDFIILDGKHFIDCVFDNCTLQYGGQAVTIESTSFRGCRFQFHSEAALTIQLLECFGLMLPETDAECSQTVQRSLRKPLPN